MYDIYLDNAATTKPYPQVIAKAAEIYGSCFGNPSSANKMGILAEREIKSAGETIIKLIGISQGDLVYTSGGTESNNLAVQGACRALIRRGRHIICSKTEHPSVLEVFGHMESEGCRVTYLNTDGMGYVDLEQLEQSIAEDTVLVSIIHVNNETGTINDIRKINAVIKKKNSNTLFHSDGVSAFAKQMPVFNYVDMYSFCAHKIHGLKGAGALYIKKGTRLKPLFFGGGQQGGIRPGTEDPAGVAVFAEAVRLSFEDINEKNRYVSGLKERLITGLSSLEGVSINGDRANGSPYILNMSFEGIKAEVLLNMLGDDGIYVSTGAACSSRDRKKSSLTALGLGEERIQSSLRFSFSGMNTAEEMDMTAERLIKHIKTLRERHGK